MPKKHQIIVYADDLEFVGLYDSWNDTARQVLKDEKAGSKISKYIAGKVNDLEGYIFLDFQGYMTAQSIESYRKLARSRKLLSNIFKIDTELIARLSEEDAQTIDKIVQKYI
jgi:hypothetical protein